MFGRWTGSRILRSKGRKTRACISRCVAAGGGKGEEEVVERGWKSVIVLIDCGLSGPDLDVHVVNLVYLWNERRCFVARFDSPSVKLAVIEIDYR